MVHALVQRSQNWVAHCGNIFFFSKERKPCDVTVSDGHGRLDADHFAMLFFQAYDCWQTPVSYLPRDKFCCG